MHANYTAVVKFKCLNCFVILPRNWRQDNNQVYRGDPAKRLPFHVHVCRWVGGKDLKVWLRLQFHLTGMRYVHARDWVLVTEWKHWEDSDGTMTNFKASVFITHSRESRFNRRTLLSIRDGWGCRLLGVLLGGVARLLMTWGKNLSVV